MGSPWAEKDGEEDRFVPLYRLDDVGNLHIWLMQSDGRVYYSPRDVDRTPRITRARIDEDRVISVEVNIPVKLCPEKGGGFRLYRSGEEEPLAEAIAWGFENSLVAANPLDLEASYELTHPLTVGHRSVSAESLTAPPLPSGSPTRAQTWALSTHPQPPLSGFGHPCPGISVKLYDKGKAAQAGPIRCRRTSRALGWVMCGAIFTAGIIHM